MFRVSRRSVVYARGEPRDTLDVVSLPRRDARWVQRSIGVAVTSRHPFPMGAVAVRGGNFLGFGVNRKRNDPRVVEDWFDCSYHAEQSLLDGVNAAGSIVYVVRVSPTGQARMARPCRTCLRLLTAAGVRRVVWTETDDTVGTLTLG